MEVVDSNRGKERRWREEKICELNKPLIVQWKAELSSGEYGSAEFLMSRGRQRRLKSSSSKNIHFEECGCLALEDDEETHVGEEVKMHESEKEKTHERVKRRKRQ
uniref:uncharacterized protein LOC122582416 n=1 Tax=Erigeron canadensis TaxID=72917 RepID=UPI001CB9C9D1|nr:uncharacterized protein LOC122582416 [Erigeron canadensis]